MVLTRESIVALLETNDKAVARALVVLYNNQTADEQETNSTHQHNGRGFSGFDADIGTKMAKFYLERGYLTKGQVAVWRKPTKGGIRIGRYWRQLLAAAEEKQRQAVEDISFNFGANV